MKQYIYIYIFKGLRATRRPPKYKIFRNMKKNNFIKYVILEGFRQNKLQIRIQRGKLSISTLHEILILKKILDFEVYNVRYMAKTLLKHC